MNVLSWHFVGLSGTVSRGLVGHGLDAGWMLVGRGLDVDWMLVGCGLDGVCGWCGHGGSQSADMGNAKQTCSRLQPCMPSSLSAS